MKLPIGLTITIVGALAFASQQTGPVIPTRRIVEGVLLLEHDARAIERAPRWTITSTPVAVAGGPNTPRAYDLTNLFDVERLADGRIFAVTMGPHLLVFSPSGRPERQLGRIGVGPGDFTRVEGIARRGDTLVIPDGANNRVNFVTVSKGFVGSKPLPARPRPAGGSYRSRGLLRAGEMVIASSILLLTKSDTVIRPSLPVMLLSRDATELKAVASIPGPEALAISWMPDGPGSATFRLRLGRLGSAIAWDTVIATGSGDGYRIDLRNLAGTIISSLRVARPRRVVTQAMRDSIIGAELRALSEPGEAGVSVVNPGRSTRLARTAPFADSLPPYDIWFTTPDRTLWVVDPRVPGDASGSAVAFRQDGAILGRLNWFGSGVPVAFDNDNVVLKVADPDGVVSLRVHRIIR